MPDIESKTAMARPCLCSIPEKQKPSMEKSIFSLSAATRTNTDNYSTCMVTVQKALGIYILGLLVY